MIYVVLLNIDYHDTLCGVYSTRERAEAAAKAVRAQHPDDETWVCDVPLDDPPALRTLMGYRDG